MAVKVVATVVVLVVEMMVVLLVVGKLNMFITKSDLALMNV